MTVPEEQKWPILCVDFDGVIHAYTSGWQGVDVIPDGPVPGAMEFLKSAVRFFDVCIYSSRSKDSRGRDAMRGAIELWLVKAFGPDGADEVLARLTFSHEKPAAFFTIDDRALCFNGTFPSAASILNFKPWNKR